MTKNLDDVEIEEGTARSDKTALDKGEENDKIGEEETAEEETPPLPDKEKDKPKDKDEDGNVEMGEAEDPPLVELLVPFKRNKLPL